jgi:ArsR family metal-binding transcriptional regulator
VEPGDKRTSQHDEDEGGAGLGSLLFPGRLVETILMGEVSICVADAERIKFIAQADRSLAEVLSILYLYLPNANYSEGLGMVSYKQNQRLATVFSTGKISMTYVKDKQEADRLVEELRGLINRAITYHIIHGSPDPKLIDVKRRLSVKAVYDSLPRTNCKECGEDSCYAFAIRLTNGDLSLDACKPILAASHVEKATHLRNMMQPIRI